MKINKERLKIDIFIAVALIAFAIFGMALIIVRPLFSNATANSPRIKDNNQYFLNTDYRDNDPLITKNPGLKEMLAGPIISEIDPVLGDKFAPVTIVYFSDFDCSFCHKQEQIFKKLLQDNPYKVRLIWKDYPKTDKESLSYKAAVAARCAQVQGKFWPYHDFLFELKGENSEAKFSKAAELVNLDKVAFKICLSKQTQDKLIADNIEEANALGINGVPFVYVNDKGFMGEVTYEELSLLVKSELGKVGK